MLLKNILYYFEKILGISCVISTIIVNMSPLLIINQVIRTNKTELIYLPQAYINLLNYSCWLIYSILKLVSIVEIILSSDVIVSLSILNNFLIVLLQISNTFLI